MKIFQMKIVGFALVKNRCMLYGHIFVMQNRRTIGRCQETGFNVTTLKLRTGLRLKHIRKIIALKTKDAFLYIFFSAVHMINMHLDHSLNLNMVILRG